MPAQKKSGSFLGTVLKGAGLIAIGGIGGAVAIKVWDKHIAKNNPDLRLTANPGPQAQQMLPPAPPQMSYGQGYGQPIAAFVTAANPLAPVMPSFFAPTMPIPLPALPYPGEPQHAAQPPAAVVAAVDKESRAAKKRRQLDEAYRDYLLEQDD